MSEPDSVAPRTYTPPVVVLMEPLNFSAADILLSALKGLPNVTLMGQPSGGGSSFARELPLTRSGLTVSLGSMIAFQVDGRWYDTRGVQPDIEVELAPEDLVRGESDRMLELAISRLRRSTTRP